MIDLALRIACLSLLMLATACGEAPATAGDVAPGPAADSGSPLDTGADAELAPVDSGRSPDGTPDLGLDAGANVDAGADGTSGEAGFSVAEPAADPPAAPRDFENPVIGAGQNPKDPQVMRTADGVFYLFHPSGNRYRVYSSRDLVSWRRMPDDALSKPSGSFWSAGTFVHEGTYNLYYTHVKGSRDRTIGVATSASPEGPYRDADPRLVVRRDASGRLLPVIDPSVFQDPATGRIYLYYARNVGTGTRPDLRCVELTDSGLATIPGTDRQVLTINQEWEHVNIEHPLVFHAPNAAPDRRYYLLYNGAGGALARYAIGYAWSASPDGPFTKAPEGDGRGDNPLVRQDPGEGIYGPGAPNTVVDAAGTRWLLYRIKTTPGETWDDRAICVDELFRNGRDQLVCTPTRGTRQVRPAF